MALSDRELSFLEWGTGRGAGVFVDTFMYKHMHPSNKAPTSLSRKETGTPRFPECVNGPPLEPFIQSIAPALKIQCEVTRA